MTDKEVLGILNDAFECQTYLERNDNLFCRITSKLYRQGYLNDAVHIVDTAKGITSVWYFPTPVNPLTDKGKVSLLQAARIVH